VHASASSSQTVSQPADTSAGAGQGSISSSATLSFPTYANVSGSSMCSASPASTSANWSHLYSDPGGSSYLASQEEPAFAQLSRDGGNLGGAQPFSFGQDHPLGEPGEMFAFPTDEASAFWQQAPANFECVSPCATPCQRLILRNTDQRTGVSSSETWPQCPHMTRRAAGSAVDPQVGVGLDVANSGWCAVGQPYDICKSSRSRIPPATWCN
jgi:hypothetical protein